MSSVPPPDHRPAKRIRQACEPCRRKKSRCPGERPNCSHCSRLGQSCYYATDHPAANEHIYSSAAGSTTSTDANRDSRDRHGSVSESADAVTAPPFAGSGPWVDRLSVLETKVAEVLGALNRMPWTASPPTPTPSGSLATCPPTIEQQSPPVTASTLPPWDTIVSVAELYLAYCSCQPLPLFDPKTFISTLGTRDPEVLFGILATAVRFSDDPLYRDRQDQAIRGYAEAARTLVTRRLANGPIELSTLQALCLLSLVDFSNGNTHRASSLSSLALDLAESAGLSTECHTLVQDSTHEERRRCFWSVLFLKKLHGGNCGVYSISADENFPKFPTSAKKPPSPDPNSDARFFQEGPRDEGITAYVIQLSEYWHRTLRYARRRANPGVHYPWSAESEYSKIMVSMMEMESHMPYKHRFRPARFAERPTEELEKQRDYWCPWLFSQMIYHTTMCLLNHPLILSLRLRNFRVSIPEIFLQHTADLIASHTDWVIHFLDILEEKSFRVTDPFIGHCVAVVATIYLQQSYADDAGIRTEKRNNFLKCLNFVRKLGTYWPHIAQIASKLQNFEATVSASYRDSAASPSPDAPQTSVFIDLTTFWEILEAVFTSAENAADAAGSLFGSSLWPPHPTSGGAAATGAPRGEVVSSRLLPEPTYPRGVDGGGRNSVSTPGTTVTAATQVGFGGSGSGSGGGGGGGGRGGGGDVMDTLVMGDNDELAVLAQSYFAQGQDFVRGVDDWWTFGQ